MTKEEFELLQRRQKASGKSVKAFLAEEGIWFTRYYYWKKKYSQPKMGAGLVFIEIHNYTESHCVSLEGIRGEIGDFDSGNWGTLQKSFQPNAMGGWRWAVPQSEFTHNKGADPMKVQY